MSPVNYWLQQPGKHADTQLYHINLKKMVDRNPVVSDFSTLPTDLHKSTLVLWGDDLTPTQCQELTDLVDQFADIFASSPGLTHLVHHEIKTPKGVVRQ